MARIKNTQIYDYNLPSFDDYVIGTDAEDSLRTKNFRIADIVALVDGSAVNFLDLLDTPSDYSGQTGKIVAVNATEDAVEFIDAPSSGGGPSIIASKTGDFKNTAGAGFDTYFTYNTSPNEFKAGDILRIVMFGYTLSSANDKQLDIDFTGGMGSGGVVTVNPFRSSTNGTSLNWKTEAEVMIESNSSQHSIGKTTYNNFSTSVNAFSQHNVRNEVSADLTMAGTIEFKIGCDDANTIAVRGCYIEHIPS